MRTLIVEDDFTCRKIMQHFLAPYGECDIAVDGKEAIQAFNEALKNKTPYDLICLDIMMPELDGHGVLKEVRNIEAQYGISEQNNVKVIMTTALSDSKNFINAYQEKCMDGMDFVGASGIGIFAETIKILNQKKDQIRLCNVKTEFMRVFKLYNMDALDAVIYQFENDDTENLNQVMGNRKKTFQN